MYIPATPSGWERFLKMSEALMSDAMKWEELRIKVALAAIGLVGAIVAFVIGDKQSVLESRPLLAVAAVLITMVGALSFILVGRYTLSFHREYHLARAYRKAWLRKRDSDYVERKFKDAVEKRDWRYYLNLWPLGQLVLVAIGLFLLAVALCWPELIRNWPK